MVLDDTTGDIIAFFTTLHYGVTPNHVVVSGIKTPRVSIEIPLLIAEVIAGIWRKQ